MKLSQILLPSILSLKPAVRETPLHCSLSLCWFLFWKLGSTSTQRMLLQLCPQNL